MSKKDVEKLFKDDALKAILNINSKENIKLSDSFVDDLGYDSLDLAELRTDIEEHFDIELDESDMETVITVEDLLELVVRAKK